MIPVPSHQPILDGLKSYSVNVEQAKALAASGLGLGTLLSLIATYGKGIIPLLVQHGPQILSLLQSLSGGGLSATDILSMLQEMLKSVGGPPPKAA